MMNDKKQQAKTLYFQTDLTKTQIAETLHISRRALTNWVKDGDWNRLKEAARHLPAILAENCYHIIGHLTEYYLSERRLTNPVSHKEADTLFKLACTIGKLKNRAALNDSMEMLGFFMNDLNAKNEKLAQELVPYVDSYLSGRASIHPVDVMPAHFTGVGGRIPWESDEQVKEKAHEDFIDRQLEFYADPETIRLHTECNLPVLTEEEICKTPRNTTPEQFPDQNELRLAEYAKYRARKEREEADLAAALLPLTPIPPAP